MTMLVDSHCHLNFPDFVGERAAVIERARSAGVGTMLTICTKLSEFDDIREIAASDPDIWCSAGTHPHEAQEEPNTIVETLIRHAEDPKVIGIGECGLDFHYDMSPRDTQTLVFQTHIEAARECGLPLIVHTREADEETGALLSARAQDGRLAGVLHCFTSGRALAERAVDFGFYISFSGIITFKNAADLRDVVRATPLDRILVETDAPFLAPVPKRGKRNEPAFVVHTAATVAELKGLSIAELTAQSTANFHRLFSKAKPFSGVAAKAGVE